MIKTWNFHLPSEQTENQNRNLTNFHPTLTCFNCSRCFSSEVLEKGNFAKRSTSETAWRLKVTPFSTTRILNQVWWVKSYFPKKTIIMPWVLPKHWEGNLGIFRIDEREPPTKIVMIICLLLQQGLGIPQILPFMVLKKKNSRAIADVKEFSPQKQFYAGLWHGIVPQQPYNLGVKLHSIISGGTLDTSWWHLSAFFFFFLDLFLHTNGPGKKRRQHVVTWLFET